MTKVKKKIMLGKLKPGLTENDLFPSPFLKGDELTGEAILTFDFFAYEEVTAPGGKKDTALVAHFQEEVKPCIINVTNYRVLKKLYGSEDPTEWSGKKAIFFSQGGIWNPSLQEKGNAVRIRPALPKTEKTEITEERFQKMLEAIKAGKFSKEAALDGFELSNSQKGLINAL